MVGSKTVPDHGWYTPENGVVAAPDATAPLAVVTFYRSYLTAADTAPVDAMIHALRDRGFAAYGLFASSLKSPAAAAFTAAELTPNKPPASATPPAFPAKARDAAPPRLVAAACPFFRVPPPPPLLLNTTPDPTKQSQITFASFC